MMCCSFEGIELTFVRNIRVGAVDEEPFDQRRPGEYMAIWYQSSNGPGCGLSFTSVLYYHLAGLCY